MKAYIKYFSVFIIIVTITAGCSEKKSVNPNAEDSSKIAEDTGTYKIVIEPTLPAPLLTPMKSYRGGGGLFILSMEPGDNFGGDVQLTLDANQALNAKLTTDLLSLDTKVAEVEIYPDSTISIGAEIIKVFSEHADVADTLELEVEIVEPEIVEPDSMSIGRYAIKLHDEFVLFVKETYPELGITTGQDWFNYNQHPIVLYGTPGKWTFLNQTWDMTVYWTVWPKMPVWFLLRKRGESEPVFAAFKNMDVTIHEIPVDEFGK